MDNKGSMLDVIMIIVVIFASIIVAMLAYNLWVEIESKLRGVSELADPVLDMGGNAVVIWNQLIPMGFVGLLIAVIAGAFMIKAHPVFFLGSVIVLIITIILAAQFSNIFDTIAVNNTVIGASATEQFPLTYIMMNNLPTIAVVVGLIVMVVMYLKGKEGVVGL